MTTGTRRPSRLKTLPERHDTVIAKLRKISAAHATTAPPTWLREMAEVRREQAEVYRKAALQHHVDSIEWHGLHEAAVLLEQLAESHLTSAALAEAGTGREGA